MTYHGRIEGGVVVLESGAELPNGTRVRVEVEVEENLDPLFLMGDLAVDTGIEDLATNVDHYLYGHPKVDE